MLRPEMPAKKFSPWVRFQPPEVSSHSDLPEFLEAVNIVTEYRQKKRRTAALKRYKRATQKLNLLMDCEVTPEAQEIIRQLRSDLAPAGPDRFHVDCELRSLPLDQLRFHLDELLIELNQRANEGDLGAVEAIVKIACDSGLSVSGFELLHPEQMRLIARRSPAWPVMRRDEFDDENRIRERLELLEVGQDLFWIRCKFKRLRGADMNYPSRQWAKRSVRTLEECRWRLSHSSRKKMFQLSTLERCNLILAEEPAWFRDFGLPLSPFSSESAEEWIPVIREMIRTDIPEFHMHGDWTNQRRTLGADGRATKGAIQNAILDDICSALRKLAR